MAWNFRRRIKILPGVHLNVSKKGVSTTFGVRGASITTGRNGTYLNTSIPGTGMYNRQKIGGKSSNTNNYAQFNNNNMSNMNNSGCLVSGGLVLTWIVLILTALGVFAFSTIWGVIYAVAVVIVKIATRTKREEIVGDNQKTVIETMPIIEKIKSNPKEIDEKEQKDKFSIVDVDSELTERERERFSDLCQKFSELSTCSKIWFVKSLGRDVRQTETIDRQEIRFSMGNLKGFKTSFKIPIIKNEAHTEYYIYPRFIVKKNLNDMEKIPIEDIDIAFNAVRFIEDLSHEIHIANLLSKPFSYEDNLPQGTKIIDYKFKYTNKDGSPNLRYSFNPRMPIVEYGEIKFEQLWLDYYFTNAEKAEKFVKSFQHLRDKTSNEAIENRIISQDFFNEVSKSVDKLFSDLYIPLKNNKRFISLTKKFGLFEKDKERLVADLFTMDILTCFVKFNEKINLDTKSGIGLLLWLVKITTDVVILQPNHLNIYQPTAQKLADIYLNKRDIYLTSFPNIGLFVADLLSDYAELRTKYFISLYRFASIAAKADNKVTEDEQKWLSTLLKLSDTKLNEKVLEEEVELQPKIIKPKTSKLKSLIGLTSVKEEIETLTNFIKIQQQREAKGMKTSSVSYHCVFTGNPGTGKTTVARIVADIYKSLGILSEGHLVETDRSGLVAEYVGQTAVKTNKIIDSALDGVLFIDEAYSLISNSQNDYGKEAIATLLKRMEDNRDKLVVILAGYSVEMQQFIDSNPGLQSRFNRYIEFPDYSAEELYQIFEKNAKEFDYKISKDAEIPLKVFFESKVANKDKNFGNARFVRNLFEKTIERQANRLSKEVDLTDEKLSEICTIDIPM
jgi:SpoVK/Ycf46/Vps4 family AAA+-type ATPase